MQQSDIFPKNMVIWKNIKRNDVLKVFFAFENIRENHNGVAYIPVKIFSANLNFVLLGGVE